MQHVYNCFHLPHSLSHHPAFCPSGSSNRCSKSVGLSCTDCTRQLSVNTCMCRPRERALQRNKPTPQGVLPFGEKRMPVMCTACRDIASHPEALPVVAWRLCSLQLRVEVPTTYVAGLLLAIFTITKIRREKQRKEEQKKECQRHMATLADVLHLAHNILL